MWNIASASKPRMGDLRSERGKVLDFYSSRQLSLLMLRLLGIAARQTAFACFQRLSGLQCQAPGGAVQMRHQARCL